VTVTLGEGNTPLLRAPRLSERFGVDLWLKCEGLNPTGSFKDRGMAVAVTRAVEAGATRLVCASTGNTAASSAAYAARAGIEAVIVVVAGATASSKLVQVRAVGATIVEVEGTFSDAYAEASRLASEDGAVLVNSGGNDDRLEGQKTAAFEILEQLGGLPDVLALPYGGGGNTRAYARGFEEAASALPRLHPVQAEDRAHTHASAIRIVDPVHRAEAEEAVARSGGSVVTVSDDEIAAAWRLLGHEEGLFCERASAAGIAGLARYAREGERVVCVLTGHGLKDPEAVAA
jgi:threonine synthase